VRVYDTDYENSHSAIYVAISLHISLAYRPPDVFQRCEMLGCFALSVNGDKIDKSSNSSQIERINFLNGNDMSNKEMDGSRTFEPAFVSKSGIGALTIH
jgi:hypothetical protein